MNEKKENVGDEMLGIYSLSLLSSIISFIVALMVTPWLIKKMRNAGITGRDMNKEDRPLIPEIDFI